MNCEQAIELLPWWLNGTLEAEERRAADEHLASCTSCREALDETRQAARTFGQHLPPEVLVARAYGEKLDGFDPALAERHLESCPQCAADLELARLSRRLEDDDRIAVMPFAAPAADPSKAASRPAASRIWRSSALAASLVGVLALSGWIHSGLRVRSLEALLAERSGAASPDSSAAAPAAPTGSPAPAADPAAERLTALEAQLRDMASTQAAQLEKERQLREQLERMSAAPPSAGAAAAAPQINSFVQDVEASGIAERAERGEPAARSIEIPASTTASTLLLAAEHTETHRDHDIEVVDAAGKPVWSSRGLRRNPGTDDYSITFPPGFLKPGSYTIRISAPASPDGGSGRQVPTESYAIRVK